MPRDARNRSESGIYHIMLRGINRQNIFQDDWDIERLLETIKRYKEVSKFEIYAYCIMSNHIHMLIKEMDESISDIIKRISSSYVFWYNKKYERCGHLFQERYKSEAVEDDEKVRVPDIELKKLFIKLGVMDPKKLKSQDRNKRDEIIKIMKETNGVTVRQLSRMTGLSKSQIGRI